MPKADDASKPRSNSSVDIKLDAPLMLAIEEERARLMQVESLLDCLLAAMDKDGDDTGDPYYPSVIELARELVNRTIEQLDSVKLKPLIQQGMEGAAPAAAEEKLNAGFGEHVVRDGDVIYVS